MGWESAGLETRIPAGLVGMRKRTPTRAENRTRTQVHDVLQHLRRDESRAQTILAAAEDVTGRLGRQAVRLCLRLRPYQTRQEVTGAMGWPFLQPKALAKASKFWTVPLTRQRPGECGSTSTSCRAMASERFSHHTWAKPMK